MYTTQYILDIANICISLVIQAIEKGVEQDIHLPRKILMCSQSLNDYYTDDPTNEDIPLTSNFLWAICGGYAFEAQNLYGGSGGIVVPPSSGGGGLTPYPINVTISAGQSGVSTLQNSDWVGLEDINQVVINQSVYQSGTGFTFNSITGQFSFALSGYILQTGDVVTALGFKPTS